MAVNSSRTLTDDLSLTDALEFFILKKMMGLHTITLAEVLEVNATKTRMTVQSLVNNLNNKDQSVPAPKIYDVPCGSMRGGNAGLITEFKKDDNVLIGFCERQIDGVKRTQARQTPSLFRTHSLEDAIIIAHWANTPPSIYVKITDDEIEIQAVDKPITIVTTGNTMIKATNATVEATTLATIKAPIIKLDGAVQATSTMTVTTSVTSPIINGGTTTISNAGISSSTGNTNVDNKLFLAHTHGNGNAGNPTTGVL